ncbi:MFS transporter [Candidatus Peregrinibacteria bacterium]|jgi:MFS family permease|nr:MFS transporter [Candidatus Peregrinibacteria bacterium]
MIHRFKPLALSKSGIITLIAVIQNYASSILSIVLPLYLYELFKSEIIIGQLGTIAGITGVVSGFFLSWLLSKIERGKLFKIVTLMAISAVLIFFIMQSFLEAASSRIILAVPEVIAFAILSLYLRDLCTPHNLARTQGWFQSLVNIAWLTGPIIGGFLISFVQKNTEIIQSLEIFHSFNPLYIQYYIPLILVMLLYSIALITFFLAKIVIRHPHLQEKTHSHKSNQVHHPKHFKNVLSFFQNPYRTFCFINISFISLWWVFIFGFFAILLEQQEISAKYIGMIIGLVSLPNALFEVFLPHIIKFFKGSINALIGGYSFFAFFITLAFLQGFENIYIFVILLIVSQIGVAVTEPLQEYMYFEGTNKKNEESYYSMHQIGGRIIGLIAPMLIGSAIAAFGIVETFSFIPYLFVPLLILLFYLKKQAATN